VTTVLGAVFALALLDQFLNQPRAHTAAWTLGMLAFTPGVFAQVWGVAGGWNDAVYRLWYWCGAIVGALWLGVGSIYLLARGRWWGHAFAVGAALISLVGAIVLLTSSIAPGFAFPGPERVIRGDGIAESARRVAAVANILGTLAIVGVALWSAWRFYRSRRNPRRGISSVAIAVGTGIVAAGGSLSRFEVSVPFYLTQLAGLAVIFAGFLVSVEVFALFRVPFTGGGVLRPGAGNDAS